MNEIMTINGIKCYEKDGTAYLKLENVARGLGFTETAASGNECVRWRTVRKYLSDIGVSLSDMSIATCGDEKSLTDMFIPENVFYRLAMKAKNETAEKFQALVADEIIPSIRKTGGYIAGQNEMSDEELMSRALDVAHRILAEREQRLREKEKRVYELEAETATQKQIIEDFIPVKQYVDTILESKDSVTVTQIAADYGISAKQLNRILKEERIQYKVNGQWILYRKYQGKGYTDSKTYLFTRTTGEQGTSMLTRWTQSGRLMIHEILKHRGIVPMMDRKQAQNDSSCSEIPNNLYR